MNELNMFINTATILFCLGGIFSVYMVRMTPKEI